MTLRILIGRALWWFLGAAVRAEERNRARCRALGVPDAARLQ